MKPGGSMRFGAGVLALAVLATSACAGGCTGPDASPGTVSSPGTRDAAAGSFGEAGAGGGLDAGTSPSDADAQDAAPPALARIHYLGRFDTRDAAGPRFAWPGSAIAATFQGTGIKVTLTDGGTDDFTVVVDGGSPVKLATAGTKTTYALAANLTAGRHTVVLTKRTESFVGVVQFLGFAVQGTGGALVASPDPFSRRIEYVGDSITCGYGNLGAGPSCAFSDDTEDETVAYGALTAAALGAQQTVIAYSGKGIYRDSNGATGNQMPVLFGLTLADDATSAWAFQTAPPDVVVVNLSTNDFSKGDPGTIFEQDYEAFLHQIRAKYANAFLICTASPMLSGASRTASVDSIETAVQALNLGGDARVTMMRLPGDGGVASDGGDSTGFAEQQASDGYGCAYHPSTKTDGLMATALEAEIRRVTGW